VATDSRTTYGEADFVRDIDRKIETLNEKVARARMFDTLDGAI